MYIYVCMCGPSPQFMAHSSLKSWNFLNAGSGKVVFCYVHEVTWKALKGWGLVARGANIAIRGLELSVPPPQTPPHLRREERDYKWNPITQGQQFNWSCLWLPWWLSSKESTCTTGDAGSVPGSGRSLEKEVATHSSVLAWRIPWKEKPGEL